MMRSTAAFCRPLALAAMASVGLPFVLTAGVARADLAEERLATYAVQNRAFELGHELAVAAGVLPINAFSKGLTAGGSYTYHFSDVWAWEVAHFEYTYGIDTGLKKELLENFDVEPTQIESVQYFGGTNLVLKPLYGKFAWFNESVVHAEIFLTFGAALGRYQNPLSFRPAGEGGGGLRIHVGKHSSFRIDVRDYVFMKGFSPKNELHVALAYALAFGRD